MLHFAAAKISDNRHHISILYCSNYNLIIRLFSLSFNYPIMQRTYFSTTKTHITEHQKKKPHYTNNILREKGSRMHSHRIRERDCRRNGSVSRQNCTASHSWACSPLSLSLSLHLARDIFAHRDSPVQPANTRARSLPLERGRRYSQSSSVAVLSTYIYIYASVAHHVVTPSHSRDDAVGRPCAVLLVFSRE